MSNQAIPLQALPLLYTAPLASPVGVADGGTGKTSLTAYAVLAGGTTGTAAMQQVSGVGTSGQVLTSNGAAALPTWQTASAGAPGGSDTQQQFNDGGAFAGATHVTYNKSTGVETFAKGLILKNGPDADPVIGVELTATNDERLTVRYGSNTAQGKATITDGSLLNADRTRMAVNASIGESGLVMCKYSNAATTGTTEQTLDSYVIPANTYNSKTNLFRLWAVFKTAANGNNKTFKVTFGTATTLTATRALNNGTIRLMMDFVRTGSNAQLWYGEYLSIAGGTSWDSEAGTFGSPTETDTSTITLAIKATTPTASGDMTLLYWTLEAMSAP